MALFVCIFIVGFFIAWGFSGSFFVAKFEQNGGIRMIIITRLDFKNNF